LLQLINEGAGCIQGARLRRDRMLSLFLRLSPAKLLLIAAGMIVAIAIIDWRVELNVSFGFLYLFPMLIVGSCLPQWQLALLAAACTVLAERFAPFQWESAAGVPRDFFMFASYFGAALFASESARNRRLTAQHVRELEQEAELRRDAEQQLHALIESSPAAILTMDAAGKILMANQAAHRLLGFDGDALPGKLVKDFLPPLARVPPADDSTPSFRAGMQCSGRRKDGDEFLADVWFSTYKTSAGPRLAAMLVDSSEEFRDKEESSFHHLLAASRLAVGAVSHEVRNVCGAISVVYENLSRHRELAHSEDFRALGDLVEGLGKIAAFELRQTAGGEEPASVDVDSVLEDLRIVTVPSLRESGITVYWDVPSDLPRVWAERHNLFQVLLNLTKNSVRALQNEPIKELHVGAREEAGRVMVRVRDTGHGMVNPERLFRPFQDGAEAAGLGLYLSRAMVRSFNGDLRYEPVPQGCCFALELMPCSERDGEETPPEPS
jgi:two-component system, LuxR family, sensor kinase FixL